MTEHSSAKVQDIHRELHSHLPLEPALRVKALESLLVEKGMIDPRTIDAWIEVYSEDIGPKRGAQIVARAWTDPDFKRRLFVVSPSEFTSPALDGQPGAKVLSHGRNRALMRILILLRHKMRWMVGMSHVVWQHGHRVSVLARATMSRLRSVAREVSTWRSGRIGGCAGSGAAG